MTYTKKIVVTAIVFYFSVSLLGAQSDSNAGAMSKDAQARMDRALSGQSSTGTQNTQSAQSTQNRAGAQSSGGIVAAAAAPGVPPPVITKDKNGKPNWVQKKDDAYNKQYYISAVGYGTTRQSAESSAFGNLTGLFGQSVKSNISSVETYKERITDGAVSIQSGQDTASAIEVSSSMDQLIGAEIGDRWEDKSTKPATFYAVAIMEKPRTIKIYSELIDANLALITKAINLSAADKASFEGIIRYQFAASLAEANDVFATVLSVIGGPDKKAGLTSADDYRYEAGNIAKKVPINVVVKNDMNGRLKAAFAGVFSEMGFRTGNSGSRYVLNATLTISPVELNNQNKFSRYEIDANLVDTTDNTVLMPYSVNGREGHANQSEADQRALRAAEGKVKEAYAENLEEFLASAIPKRQ
jgi:hypothetical protein